MTCPYCNFKNMPHAVTCHQCGILLRLGRTSRFLPPAGSGGGSGLAFVRGLLPGNRLKAQQAALQARLTALAAEITERAEAETENPATALRSRSVLATLALLQGHVEKSIQGFQQARQKGAKDAEFFNNTGIALARRGSSQAAEMFEHAIRASPDLTAPFANAAHLFVEAGAEPDPSAAALALGKLQRALDREPKNPTLHLRLARIQCRERRFDQAVAACRAALACAGGMPVELADAQNDLGLALALSGDMTGAATAFEAALQADPRHAPALCNQCLTQMPEAMTGAALEKLARAAHIDPASAALRTNHGGGLCRMGAINEGIVELKEALGLNARLLEANYNLGKTYADHDALDIAERYLTRALQMNPRSGEALIAMGVVKTQQKMLPQAIQYFETAAKGAPKTALPRANLGIVQGLAGNHELAMRILRKAADLNSRDPQIPAQIGWLHLMLGNLTTGLDELEIAHKLDPHIAEVHNNFGLCYVALGKPGQAVPHFARALELKPDMHALHYQWGYALAGQHDYSGALREWDRTVRHEPTNADCHANRGCAFYLTGHFDEAIAAFRQVLTLRQNRAEDYANLGLAYAKSGEALRQTVRNPQDPRQKQVLERHTTAIEMFDKGLALAPRNVMLHSNRGLACFFSSRPETAMREWALVSKIDPDYARRRGEQQQSEFDDSQVKMMPLQVSARAASLPPKTGPYLTRFVPGYEADEWDYLLSDPELIRFAEMRREAQRLDRVVNAA